MENNTKIAIGLAAAVVVGYIVYKSSKPKTQSGSTPSPEVNTTDYTICPDGYTKEIKVVGGVVGIIRICKNENGEEVYPVENPNYIDTTSEYICPKGSYIQGGQYGYPETCSDGTMPTKNPNWKFCPEGKQLVYEGNTPKCISTTPLPSSVITPNNPFKK